MPRAIRHNVVEANIIEGEFVNVRRVVSLVWSRKLLVCAAGLVGAAIGLGVAQYLPKHYRSEAAVVVRAEATVVPDPERAFNAAVINDSMVMTEKEVLTARGLLSRVAQTVSFPAVYDRIGIAARLATSLQAALHASPAAQSVLEALDRPLQRMGLVDVSRTLDSMLTPAPPSEGLRQEQHLKIVTNAIRVVANKGSSVIRINATTVDPQFSADIVNTLVKLYMQDRLAAQESVALNAKTTLDEIMQKTKEEISSAETRVATLSREPGLLENIAVPDTMRDIAVLGVRLTEARAELAARRSAYEQALRARDAANGDPIRALQALDPGDQTTADLLRQYTDREQELARLSARLSRGHPATVAIAAQLEQLRRAFDANIERVVARKQANVEVASQSVATLASRYKDLQQEMTKREGAVLVLQREREVLANLRTTAAKIDDRIIGLTARPLDPNARIVSFGEVPLAASFPNKPLVTLLGMLMGSCVALFSVVARGYAGQMRRTPAEEARFLSGPFLGSLPRLKTSTLAQRRSSGGVPAVDGEAALRAALFQSIAVAVEEIVERQDLKVFTITSGVPEEGKTTVAYGLALALARLGKRVLLIDCDLHGARAPSAFPNTLPRAAATDHSETEKLAGVVPYRGTGLHVLNLPERVSEPPVQYFRSAEFRRILEFGRSSYDVVLCDTPPVLAVPDPVLVAKQSDAIVLIAEHGRNEIEADADEIVRRLGIAGKSVCGVVVTKTDPQNARLNSYAEYYHSPRRRPQPIPFVDS